MVKYNGFCFDIESDGFLFQAKKVWSIVLTDLSSGEKLKVRPFSDKDAKAKIENWVHGYANPLVVGHNILGFDVFLLKCIMGIDFKVGKPDSFCGKPCQFVDTYYLSMFLWPDRPGHSVEDFGERLGLEKIDWRERAIQLGLIGRNAPDGAQFLQFHPEMEVYCERDVDVNILVFKSLMAEYENFYGEFTGEFGQHYKAGQKSFFLMSCQEYSGFKFDTKFAIELSQRIGDMMEEIRANVEPLLPKRSLKKGEMGNYTMPSKIYTNKGELTAITVKWIEKHNGVLVADRSFEHSHIYNFYGKDYELIPKQMLDVQLPMEMADQNQMKEYFLTSGWEPTMWNLQKGPDGKPIRDLKTRQAIKTSPKIQEAGKICPNLFKLEGDIVQQVVKWLSLRNRQSVLNGWIGNERLSYDGRIGAGRSGIAATHRQKHKVVVNVPKASDKVLLGKEFRSLWVAEEGFLIAAGDAAALEGRVQGHYVWRYDNGETAKELLAGDIHSKTAKSVYADELRHIDINSPDFNKDDPFFKPYRDRSKNVFYACLPMHTKVLTLNGWKEYADISEGDAILSFNAEKGVVEEDTVLKKHFFTDKVVNEYSNSRDTIQCTEDHRWYGWRRSKTKGKPSSKVFGFFEAGDFTQEHNIILTAPWTGRVESQLSDNDCALLGWLASDGYWKWAAESDGPSTSNGKKRGVAMKVYQSLNKFHGEIRELLDRMQLQYSVYEDGRENGNNVVHFTISPKDARPFLERATGCRLDKHDIDWVKLVLSMTRSNLEAFYDAFYKGDGDLGKREGIGQARGNIFDGVLTAAQLIGNGRITINKKSGTVKEMGNIVVHKRKHMTCQEISVKEIGVQDTFCLTTKNSSFIIWQGDFVGITGNCLYGAGDAKLASTAGLPESKGKEVSERFWKANWGTKELKDRLEGYWETTGQKKYLPAIDGRILHTRKKSALLNTIFQSCGGIVMDYACCFLDSWFGDIHFDDKRRPYYLYKGAVIRRVAYVHDEVEFECEEPVAEEVSRMIEMAIKKSGEFLKLKVELAGEGKTGKSWKEVH